jgi:hypothetical protein
MNIAIYRMYYGEDFIEKSINSIIDDIDMVFVMYSDIPWGGFDSVMYKGKKINIPCPIDRSVHIVKDMELKYQKENRPQKIFSFCMNLPKPDNQFTILFNFIKGFLSDKEINVVMLMEPDMVWPEGKLKPLLNTLEKSLFSPLCTYQIEFWKSEKYIIPLRERPGAIFYSVSGGRNMPNTCKNGSFPGMLFIDEFIYNYGFCLSIRGMFYKHILAIGNSPLIGDSIPNEDWFEKKWVSWDYKRNNLNLEISKNYAHLIPHAIKYDYKENYITGRCLHIDRS